MTAARTATVDGVRITAEMQTPSSTVALHLHSPTVPNDDGNDPSGVVTLEPGQTVQNIVRFDLKEPGNHVLVVTVTYTEIISSSSSSSPSSSSSSSSGRRVRTFRKLYQFLAEPSLAVRTKTIELAATTVAGDRREVTRGSRYLIEAQLENMSQDLMTLEVIYTSDLIGICGGSICVANDPQIVDLVARPPLRSTSLNWDVSPPPTSLTTTTTTTTTTESTPRPPPTLSRR